MKSQIKHINIHSVHLISEMFRIYLPLIHMARKFALHFCYYQSEYIGSGRVRGERGSGRVRGKRGSGRVGGKGGVVWFGERGSGRVRRKGRSGRVRGKGGSGRVRGKGVELGGKGRVRVRGKGVGLGLEEKG